MQDQRSPEHVVLAAILRDNAVYHHAVNVIDGMDFADARLGGVFDGMCRHIAAGGKVDAMDVAFYFPEWGVVGVGPEEPWVWLDSCFMSSEIIRATEIVKAQSLRRTGQAAFRQGLEDLNDYSKSPAEVIEHVNRAIVAKPRHSLQTVTLNDVLATPDTEDWVIPGLMERKDRLILTGHEGLGKTTMVRQMLILPAAGIHPFTNERIEPVKALVIDAENTAKQWMRAARWFVQRAQASYGADPGSRIHMALSGRVNILDPSTLGGIHRLIDQHKPDVVFLGPLYRLAVHMNSDEQIAPVIAALDTIRDRDVALIIEAHAGHAVGVNGVRDVRPRGSSALLGWPEFGFGIRKDVSVDANANAFEFVAWRGAREQRDWPERLIRGDWSLGDWPWVSVPNY